MVTHKILVTCINILRCFMNINYFLQVLLRGVHDCRIHSFKIRYLLSSFDFQEDMFTEIYNKAF